jgi:hypothetical protein
MDAKEKVHLIEYGDSLGLTEVIPACNSSNKEGDIGYFGFDGTISRVNCRACMKTDFFRQMCKDVGFEHPFTTAAKKAHETIARKKKQHNNKLISLAKQMGELSEKDFELVMHNVDFLRSGHVMCCDCEYYTGDHCNVSNDVLNMTSDTRIWKMDGEVVACPAGKAGG